jgi:hypothetical protein
MFKYSENGVIESLDKIEICGKILHYDTGDFTCKREKGHEGRHDTLQWRAKK